MLMNILKDLIVDFQSFSSGLPTTLFLIYSFWKIAAEDIDIITNWYLTYIKE